MQNQDPRKHFVKENTFSQLFNASTEREFTRMHTLLQEWVNHKAKTHAQRLPAPERYIEDLRAIGFLNIFDMLNNYKNNGTAPDGIVQAMHDKVNRAMRSFVQEELDQKKIKSGYARIAPAIASEPSETPQNNYQEDIDDIKSYFMAKKRRQLNSSDTKEQHDRNIDIFMRVVDGGETQEEVGDLYGITGTWVSAICKRKLAGIKKAIENGSLQLHAAPTYAK